MLENTYRKYPSQINIEEHYHFDKICESLIKTNDHADLADIVTREQVEKYQNAEDKKVERTYEVLRKKYAKTLGERMDELIDKIYEFPTTPVTDFQHIWKPYNKMCDEMEEEDFLVKNIKLFKVKLAMSKMTKDNTLNDGHKVKVADLITEREKGNDKVKGEFDSAIEEIQYNMF